MKILFSISRADLKLKNFSAAEKIYEGEVTKKRDVRQIASILRKIQVPCATDNVQEERKVI